MKTTLLIIASLFILCSCSTVKQSTPQRFVPIVRIKAEYNLTNKECRKVYEYARLDSLNSYYNCGTDQRLFDPTFNYSIFKK